MAKSQKTHPAKQRLMTEAKVRRVLEGMGVDFVKFKKAYEAEPSHRGRGMRAPSTEETQAVEVFLKTGDFGALKKALRTENLQKANAAVARVIAFRARRQAGD